MMLSFAIFRCGSNSIIDLVSQFLISMGPIIYCSVEKKNEDSHPEVRLWPRIAGRSLHIFTTMSAHQNRNENVFANREREKIYAHKNKSPTHKECKIFLHSLLQEKWLFYPR